MKIIPINNLKIQIRWKTTLINLKKSKLIISDLKIKKIKINNNLRNKN